MVMVLALMLTLAAPSASAAAQRMYPRTAPGTVEIKTLPAVRLMVADRDGGFFEHRNRLFPILFDYIKGHNVAMTAPVEGSLERARMAFYVGPREGGKDLPDTGRVAVVSLPERTVASIGARGSYTEKNIRAHLGRVEAWVDRRPEFEQAGVPYAVYRHPPFVPWFLRRFEVHVPVKAREEGGRIEPFREPE